MINVWLSQATINVGKVKKVIGRSLNEFELKKVYTSTLTGNFDAAKLFNKGRSKTITRSKMH